MINLGLKSRLGEFETVLWDKVLGVSTLGLGRGECPNGAQFGDANWYQSKRFHLNWQFIHPLKLSPDDVFYDIGCGAGRMLCIAALGRVSKVVGIELSHELCELARRNASQLRFRRAPIEIREGDAALADYSSGTVFFLCNPFGAVTTQAVLDRLHQNVIEQPRRVRIIYIHPHSIHRQIFDTAKWLHPVREQQFIAGGKTTACYYEHIPPAKTSGSSDGKMLSNIARAVTPGIWPG